MITNKTTEVQNKITRVLEKLEDDSSNYSVAQLGKASSSVEGFDIGESKIISALVLAKFDGTEYVYGHIANIHISYSNIEDFEINHDSSKIIGVNSKNIDRVKFYYSDSRGFNIELTPESLLSIGDILVFFIETLESSTLLMGTNDPLKGSVHISLISADNIQGNKFLRQNLLYSLSTASTHAYQKLLAHISDDEF